MLHLCSVQVLSGFWYQTRVQMFYATLEHAFFRAAASALVFRFQSDGRDISTYTPKSRHYRIVGAKTHVKKVLLLKFHPKQTSQ